MNEEEIRREAEQISQELEKEKGKRITIGPLKYIIMLFLILIVILWVVPYYSVRLNPEPKHIPAIEDVVPKNIEIGNETYSVNNRYDYLRFIKPNDPVVKQTADRIVSLSGCGNNKICQAKAVFYFIRDRFDYVSDPLKYEYVKTARESLSVNVGDCDDASVLASNLLQAIGISTRFVFVPQHVYVQAYLPDAPRTLQKEGWVNLDLTCKYCRFGEVAYQYENAEKSYVG